MIDTYARGGFDVFPASEALLSKALAIGGAGCISATVNMNPAGIHALYENWNSAEGEALQARADTLRRIFQAPTMIAAMKRVLSEFAHDPDWRFVRPPLTAMDDGRLPPARVPARRAVRNAGLSDAPLIVSALRARASGAAAM